MSQQPVAEAMTSTDETFDASFPLSDTLASALRASPLLKMAAVHARPDNASDQAMLTAFAAGLDQKRVHICGVTKSLLAGDLLNQLCRFRDPVHLAYIHESPNPEVEQEAVALGVWAKKLWDFVAS